MLAQKHWPQSEWPCWACILDSSHEMCTSRPASLWLPPLLAAQRTDTAACAVMTGSSGRRLKATVPNIHTFDIEAGQSTMITGTMHQIAPHLQALPPSTQGSGCDHLIPLLEHKALDPAAESSQAPDTTPKHTCCCVGPVVSVKHQTPEPKYSGSRTSPFSIKGLTHNAVC